MYKHKITVFTPTFNRGYIIEKLYKSLQRQTFKDFEWLVIDDGSTDNTEKLFNVWNSDNNFFPIRYIKVNNGGKHRAINRAVDLANGEMFFIVDSDDYLTDTALQVVSQWEKSISNDNNFAGVSGNRGIDEDTINGTSFTGEFVDASSIEREKYNITGDKAEVYYTNMLTKYKFPEFSGENFITERVVWDRIGFDGYKIRWFNEIIYIGDYLSDGLSKSGDAIFKRNPQGTAFNVVQMMKIYKYNLKDRIANYNGFYQFVKGEVIIEDAAKYLNISLWLLKLSIFIVKCKNKITSRKGDV